MKSSLLDGKDFESAQNALSFAAYRIWLLENSPEHSERVEIIHQHLLTAARLIGEVRRLMKEGESF